MSRRFTGKLATKFNPFDDDYLTEILQCTAAAWSRMEHPDGSEIEDHITYRLAGRLANDPKFSKLPYDIVPQCWLLGLNGERLGRMDLRFKHRHSQRDYFAFESKRLHVTYPAGGFSTEYPTYVGSDGMMAFVDGIYSKGLPTGGMIAYVMDGKSDIAWAGLEKRINAQRSMLKLIEGCVVQSAHVKTVAKAMAGTHLGETVHDLSTHHLRLFHLILPVRFKHKVASRRTSRTRQGMRAKSA